MPRVWYFGLLASLALATPVGAEDKDHYAAVAFSTRTGEYWVAFAQPTREKAESEVIKNFADKEGLTVVVVRNCYVSLAMSKDGKFGVGEADSPLEARRNALAECRKLTKTRCSIVVTLHTAQGVGGDVYSAIAYSISTGRYGASVAKSSKSEAETEAIEKCKAGDAKAVVTAKNNSCALALGNDKGVFGVGVDDDEKKARQKALADCEKKTSDCRVVIAISGKK
jgi:hypothetical protein